jgi:hypothetical protein
MQHRNLNQHFWTLTQVIAAALAEDAGNGGDITTLST